MDDITPYLDFFGLGRDVSERELKAARNLFLKKFHPDSGRQHNEEMAKRTNLAYEKVMAYIKSRDRAGKGVSPASGVPGARPRPEDEYYRRKAQEFLRKQSRRQGFTLNVHENGGGDIYSDTKSSAYKKYFVDAVLNYTYTASIVKDLNYTCGWYLNVFPLRVLTAWVYQVYPDWDGNRPEIWARIRGQSYKKLFISAVNEYAREKTALSKTRCWPSAYLHPSIITGRAAHRSRAWCMPGGRLGACLAVGLVHAWRPAWCMPGGRLGACLAVGLVHAWRPLARVRVTDAQASHVSMRRHPMFRCAGIPCFDAQASLIGSPLANRSRTMHDTLQERLIVQTVGAY